MAQYGRPASDISTGIWQVAPLYEKIDEETPSDVDYISLRDERTSTFEVKLSAVDDPSSSSDHVVRVRARMTDTSPMIIYLLCGATSIANSATLYLTGLWVTYELTLSGAQADAITDYSDLRIRVSVTTNFGNAFVSWAELEVPDAGGGTTNYYYAQQ